ncbi:BAG domain-containing protein [Lasiosphaeria miniovina]|uniref:BAG domain-containing protein n=1 Tax=Lasiosphaeria miniovina TaxID=1954250 RepID=A0AA40E9R3_9PEZI|nr:BAG domain-containing protein [Lasiosphaeria miniovina]KAK0727578.1 BAG domain-containing protein [Lasiosphaeria miniovina]
MPEKIQRTTPNVKVASGSGFGASSGASFANLTASILRLPATLQPFLDSAVEHLSGATEYLQSATGVSPTVLYTTAAGALLLLGAIPAVTARNSQKKTKNTPGKGEKMSRYGWSTRAGGLSPFNSALGQGDIPAVTDEDYSYITSEDLQNHGVDNPPSYESHYAPSSDRYAGHAHPPTAPRYQPEDDVMLIKHRGITFPEHFPAYSIGDGKLLVGDVKVRAKIILDVPDSQAKGMRLLYKGQLLSDPDAPIRDYGVKDNSEVVVVLGEGGTDSSGESSHSEEVVVVGRDGREDHGARKPGKKRRGRQPVNHSPRESGPSFSLEVPRDDGRRRALSRVRTQSPKPAPAPEPLPAPEPAVARSSGITIPAPPGSAMDKLNQIASRFDKELLPLCKEFIANPPSDPKKRTMEHRKLAEVIMQQVLLKLDEVETAGEEGARQRRKDLVKEVQADLKSIDDVSKA